MAGWQEPKDVGHQGFAFVPALQETVGRVGTGGLVRPAQGGGQAQGGPGAGGKTPGAEEEEALGAGGGVQGVGGGAPGAGGKALTAGKKAPGAPEAGGERGDCGGALEHDGGQPLLSQEKMRQPVRQPFAGQRHCGVH